MGKVLKARKGKPRRKGVRKSPNQSQDEFELRKRQILKNGKAIQQFFGSEAWTEIVSPIIDESIESVSGRKAENGRWVGGHFIKSRNDESKQFYIGYATALMELNNRLHDFVKVAESVQNNTVTEKELEKAPMVSPMEIDFETMGIELGGDMPWMQS